MTRPHFPPLDLAHRPELFARIADFRTPPDRPCTPCVFGDRRGWLVHDYPTARHLLTSAAGQKSRPAASQALLGGVGAQQGDEVRQTKRQLITAMGLEAHRTDHLGTHLRHALRVPTRRSLAAPGWLTEAFAAAMLAQLTGQEPGSVDGRHVRALVRHAWRRLEAPTAASARSSDGTDDLLAARIHGLVAGGRSPFLQALRRQSWTDHRIVEELRAMVLAGWGSTTAATVSAHALRLQRPVDRPAMDEVLRLYPPSFMIARNIVAPSPQQPFTSGDLVVVSPWLIHRSERGWQVPGRFDTGRWQQTPSPHWFLPFGVGPRRCPAATFARAHILAGLDQLDALDLNPGPLRLGLVEKRSPALMPEAN